MNRTNTSTANKKTFPLRLPPAMYQKIRYRVQKEQNKGNYSYSINEFLTKIIEEGLKNNK